MFMRETAQCYLKFDHKWLFVLGFFPLPPPPTTPWFLPIPLLTFLALYFYCIVAYVGAMLMTLKVWPSPPPPLLTPTPPRHQCRSSMRLERQQTTSRKQFTMGIQVGRGTVSRTIKQVNNVTLLVYLDSIERAEELSELKTDITMSC